MQPIYIQYLNHVGYQSRLCVFYDDESLRRLYNGSDMDFDSEDEKQAYLERFEKGELNCYWIELEVPCKCCNVWSRKDSMGGFHAETPEEAIEFSMEQFDIEAVV